MTEIRDKAREKIDQTGIVLCYALFAYNDDLISEDIMNCYRDTYADQILSIPELAIVDRETKFPVAIRGDVLELNEALKQAGWVKEIK